MDQLLNLRDVEGRDLLTIAQQRADLQARRRDNQRSEADDALVTWLAAFRDQAKHGSSG